MLLLATILFIVLSPGILLTLPPVGSKVFMSRKTSLVAVLVHAVLFFLILCYRKRIFLVNRLEGFTQAGNPTTNKPIGAHCSNSSECQSNICFKPRPENPNGFCAEAENPTTNKPIGARCSNSSECQSNICFKPRPENPNGFCAGTIKNGDKCSMGLECESRNCKSNMCRGTLKVNDKCSDYLQCDAGMKCYNGKCKKIQGESCGAHNQCESNVCQFRTNTCR